MKKKSSKYSAFFEPRVFISFLLLFGAVLLVFGALGMAQGQAPASKETTPKQSTTATQTTDKNSERLSPADDPKIASGRRRSRPSPRADP